MITVSLLAATILLLLPVLSHSVLCIKCASWIKCLGPPAQPAPAFPPLTCHSFPPASASNLPAHPRPSPYSPSPKTFASLRAKYPRSEQSPSFLARGRPDNCLFSFAPLAGREVFSHSFAWNIIGVLHIAGCCRSDAPRMESLLAALLNSPCPECNTVNIVMRYHV